MIEPISATTAPLSWLWDKYGTRALEKIAGAAKAKWARVSWTERAEAYKQRVLHEHSTTKLLGNPREIRLDQIYTDVYVLDQVSAYRRLNIEDMKKAEFNRNDKPEYVKRVSLLEIAKTSRRLYILGKPGAGKSTFLKSLVRASCDGTLDKTPIFVPLKRWSDSQKLLEAFIVDEFSICNFPDAGAFVKALLESGGAMVLFDGLDEVSNIGTRRQNAIEAVTEFSRRYVNSQVILTCRTAATEYSFDKFKYVEIADFTLEQQRSFIAKWYSDRPDSRASLLREWNRDQNSGLIDLAKTPLLLALLCLAYDETLSFPRRRIELYEESVNALLRKWDASREIPRDEIYKGLSHGRKEQMLRRLALETFRRAEILIPKQALVDLISSYLNELPPDDVGQGIDGEVVLRAMEAQHGLIVERAHGVYSFSHLTIHEYFAAKKIVESTRPEEIVALMRAHAIDDQWREVILMVASVLDDGRFLIDALVKVLEEIALQEPAIATFVTAALASRETATLRGRQYGGANQGSPGELNGDAMAVSEFCIAIAANMRAIGAQDQYLALPRLLSGALQLDPLLIRHHFAGNLEALSAAKAYFQLTSLVTECLSLTTLPDRESYIRTVFSPLQPRH